mmetsp:Transcript_89857/g.259003  ORF Transcript_89857/g.259003 Transcript_89857/m.259003 type:complete len:381 (-) Transcript_89857:12-1154(-)
MYLGNLMQNPGFAKLIAQLPVQRKRLLGGGERLRVLPGEKMHAAKDARRLRVGHLVAKGAKPRCALLRDLHRDLEASLAARGMSTHDSGQGARLPTKPLRRGPLEFSEDRQGLLRVRQTVPAMALQQRPIGDCAEHGALPPPATGRCIERGALFGVLKAVFPRNLVVHFGTEGEIQRLRFELLVVDLLRQEGGLPRELEGLLGAPGPRRSVAELEEELGDDQGRLRLHLPVAEVDEDGLGVLGHLHGLGSPRLVSAVDVQLGQGQPHRRLAEAVLPRPRSLKFLLTEAPGLCDLLAELLAEEGADGNMEGPRGIPRVPTSAERCSGGLRGGEGLRRSDVELTACFRQQSPNFRAGCHPNWAPPPGCGRPMRGCQATDAWP